MKLKQSDLKKSSPEFYSFLKQNNALRQYCNNFKDEPERHLYLKGVDQFYCAFKWDETKEGFNFWYKLIKEWKEVENV